MEHDDLKEHVRHIRGIHFVLGMTCTVIVAVWTAGQSRGVEAALGQIEEVDTAVTRWEADWLEVALRSYGNARASREWPTTQLALECYECEEDQDPFVVDFGEPWTVSAWPAGLRAFMEEQTEASTTAGDPLRLRSEVVSEEGAFGFWSEQRLSPLRLHQPETVREFAQLWNALASIPLAVASLGDPRRSSALLVNVARGQYFIVSDAMRIEEEPRETWPRWTVVLQPMPAGLLDQWSDWTGYEYQLAQFHFVGMAPGSNRQLREREVVPGRRLSIAIQQSGSGDDGGFVGLDEISFDGQSALASQYGLTASAGQFRYSFADLYRSAVTLAGFDTPLEQFAVLLQEDVVRRRGQIQVFGVSVPSLEVLRWSGPVILMIQLYLLLHLRALAARLRNGSMAVLVPWIGLYPDWLSRWVVSTSAFLLPVAVLGLLFIPTMPTVSPLDL